MKKRVKKMLSSTPGPIMDLRPLPPQVQRLFDDLNVPARLRWHSILVHDVAAQLVARLWQTFPNLSLDDQAIFQGAALHDVGKMLNPERAGWSGLKA